MCAGTAPKSHRLSRRVCLRQRASRSMSIQTRAATRACTHEQNRTAIIPRARSWDSSSNTEARPRAFIFLLIGTEAVGVGAARGGQEFGEQLYWQYSEHGRQFLRYPHNIP